MLRFNVKNLFSFLAGFTFCSFLCIQTKAQLSVGIEAGYNKNYLITNNANRAFTNYQPLHGLALGLPVQYKINDWFAIATDPSLIQKDYSQVRSDFFAGVYEDTHNTYLQLPLMAHFMFGGSRLKGFVNTGVYGGYWLASRVKGVMPSILDNVDGTSSNSVYDYQNPYSYNEKYSFDTRKDNRFDAGLIGGLGISYAIDDRYEVFSEGRILYSLTDQQKNYMKNQVPRYNTTYGINAGILIHFDFKKDTY